MSMPSLVHRHCGDPRTERLEHEGRTGIAGVLHGTQRSPGSRKSRATRSSASCDPRDDGHLLGRALDAPRGAQVVRDRLAQRPISQWLAAQEESRRGAPKTASRDLGPQPRGEHPQRRQVGAKGPRATRLETRERLDASPIARQLSRLLPLGPGRRLRLSSDLEQVVGQHPAHVGARSDTAFHVAFGRELREGVDDRAPRQPVLAGEVPGAWQPRSRTQAAIQDLGAQGRIQPAVRGDSRFPRRQHQGVRGDSLGHESGPIRIPQSGPTERSTLRLQDHPSGLDERSKMDLGERSTSLYRGYPGGGQ